MTTVKHWDIRLRDPQRSVLEKIKSLREDVGMHHADPEEVLSDPFLMKDMELALERIAHAREQKERIVVFGDYDADGVTATAVLVRTLKAIGCDVSFRIPHRIKDGYSLKNYFLDELKELGVKVVITVDNGIAAAREIQHAYDLGMDIIVTDHHTPPPPDAMPRAHAILNPKVEGCSYPYKELSGSAVALKLCEALLAQFVPSSEQRDLFRKQLFQIAAVGIIADCMPLTEENRAIVQIGIKAMQEYPLVGIRALSEIAGVSLEQITSVDVAFMLAPRINAAGRIEHALTALKLFLAGEESTKDIAKILDELNKTRKETTVRFFEQAKEMLRDWSPEDKIIILSSPDWNSGINGLVASRLVELYHVPVLVFAERSDDFVGSARSIDAFNMIEALTVHREFLAHYGGHPGAAGCSILKEHFSTFVEKMKIIAQEILGDKELRGIIRIDTDIGISECTLETYKQLQRFAPFGVGNPEPRFLLERVHLSFPRAIGKEGLHLSGAIGDIRCIGFGLGTESLFFENKTVDLVVSLMENVWQGNRTLQLQIFAGRVSV